VLAGKKFVLTGSLPTLKRSEAVRMIEERGGAVGSGVTKDTDFVLAGEAAGDKLNKAEALGIKIITEEEFTALISLREE
jgi:DNA ligase (NAD+)